MESMCFRRVALSNSSRAYIDHGITFAPIVPVAPHHPEVAEKRAGASTSEGERALVCPRNIHRSCSGQALMKWG
jgi:hypothetical protein